MRKRDRDERNKISRVDLSEMFTSLLVLDFSRRTPSFWKERILFKYRLRGSPSILIYLFIVYLF